MVRKVVLRPTVAELLRGMQAQSLQGVGRPLTQFVVQMPHAAEDGESVIPSLDVAAEMTRLDGELAQSQQRVEAAVQKVDETLAPDGEWAQAIEEAKKGSGSTVRAGQGQPPEPGKAQGDVWLETTGSGDIIAQWLWDGQQWTRHQVDGATLQNLSASAITSGTMPGSRIAAGTIYGEQLAAQSIVGGHIAARAIGAAQIDVNAITAEKIAAGAVTARSLVAGAVDGQTITGATVRTGSGPTRVEMDSQNGIRVLSNGQLVAQMDDSIPNGLALRSPAGGLVPISSVVFGVQGQNRSGHGLPSADGWTDQDFTFQGIPSGRCIAIGTIQLETGAQSPDKYSFNMKLTNNAGVLAKFMGIDNIYNNVGWSSPLLNFTAVCNDVRKSGTIRGQVAAHLSNNRYVIKFVSMVLIPF